MFPCVGAPSVRLHRPPFWGEADASSFQFAGTSVPLPASFNGARVFLRSIKRKIPILRTGQRSVHTATDAHKDSNVGGPKPAILPWRYGERTLPGISTAPVHSLGHQILSP
eukprot:1318379-Pyramimonas_sp.AAC.1